MAKKPSAQDRRVEEASSDRESMETRLVEYAEQLGWMVGTVKAKADGWLDREALSKNLTSIRDGAADLLAHLTAQYKAAATGQSAKAGSAQSKGRSGGVVDAPGKTHRPAPPSTPGVKHSDERISKLKSSVATRRRSRG